MDSKIWTKESDRYTSRAIEAHEGVLYSEDNSFFEKSQIASLHIQITQKKY